MTIQEDFFVACKNGDTDTIQNLLTSSKIEIINEVDMELSDTPLIWASRNGKTEAVKLLVKTPNIDIDQQNIWGETPLMVATRNGDISTVKGLLEADADVNKADMQGFTPLMIATRDDNTAMVKVLLTSPKIDVKLANAEKFTALMIAAKNGNLATVQTLLDTHGAELKKLDTYRLALVLALRNGYTKTALALLYVDFGNDLNQANEHGYTPLMAAAQNGKTRTVELLLSDKNIDVNKKNIQGYNALMLASVNGHSHTVSLLKRHGAVLPTYLNQVVPHNITKLLRENRPNLLELEIERLRTEIHNMLQEFGGKRPCPRNHNLNAWQEHKDQADIASMQKPESSFFPRFQPVPVLFLGPQKVMRKRERDSEKLTKLDSRNVKPFI